MNKRYWLRGGLIAVGIYVLFGVLLAIYELVIAPQNAMSGLFTMLYLIGPGLFVFGIDGHEAFISFVASILLYFGIGAFIGAMFKRNN